MVGAAAGSFGTAPTNWVSTNLFGLTQTISIGVESGLQYIDFRFNGTANTTAMMEIRFEGPTQIAALNSQVWTNSTYVKLVANPSPANSIGIGMYDRNSAGTALGFGQQVITPTTSLTRFTFTRTLIGGATVAFVQPVISFNLTSGQAYDFTIRIAAPQMELGAYATTFIPTTTAAVTRLADVSQRTDVPLLLGQTEGTIFAEVVIGFIPINFVDIFGLGEFAENVFVRLNSSSQIQAVCTRAGTVTVIAQSSTITTGTYKIAFAYKNGDFALRINNNATLTSTSTNVLPTSLSKINLGSSIRAAAFEGQFTQAALFPTRLSNEELVTITTI
jgi:hypothetical protein